MIKILASIFNRPPTDRHSISAPESELPSSSARGSELDNALAHGILPETEKLLHEINRHPEIAAGLLCETMWGKHSTNPVFNLLVGSALFGYGKPDIAAMHFRQAAGLSNHSLPIYCLSRCYSATGRQEMALGTLMEGLKTFPENLRLAVETSTALFRMGKTDSANTFFRPFAKHFHADQTQCKELSDELKRAISNNAHERETKGDLYDDQFVTDLWWDYNQSFMRFNEFQEGSAFMGHLIRTEVGQAIQQESETESLIDFGVMCGLPNWQLADRFPLIKHFGIDRQPIIKSLNTKHYQKENLHFEAGDIFDFLRDNSTALKGGTLFHARTATVCYPAVVQDLYRACRKAGIKQIVAIEFAGLSKETLEFTDFRGERSVALRSNMFIHPYETMLENAGFRIKSTKLFGKYGLFLDAGLGEATACTVARV